MRCFFELSDYGGSYHSNDTNKASNDQGTKNINFSLKHSSNSVYIQPISFKKLSYLLDQTPLNIFLDIIQTDSGFLETLNRSSNSIEMILLTIKVINTIIKTPFTEHIRVFLNKVRNTSNYWSQIEAILKETTIKQRSNTASKQKKKNKVVLHRSSSDVWQHVQELSFSIAKYIGLPGGFIRNIFIIIDENKNNELNLSEFKLKFETLLKDLESANKDRECFQTYHQMDIHPNLDELKQKQKLSEYVKPNIIKGRFESVAHYLDIHLALLREDFIQPLRDGICQIIEEMSLDPTIAEPRSNFNVRVYPNVRILTKQYSKGNFKSENLVVDLESKSRSESKAYEQINNNKCSKKLMYGSLLCFTSKDIMFEDLIIAVVSNRDVPSQGFVSLFAN